ncbi:unknown [Crocosphaera subtropica ATCC 51142]|uniref:Beta-lactamase-related domain-containing protein n=1 Tax=Crocosphaera subtropica (strain ATCC 51142 / BH68) TaxID=43989 RepID=B1WRB8_CROS5|nr:serine hydrolase [Crocosphaera subtropica]ACB51767.1 unknown [Crocosphaera subtropica ATCC 51142]
MLSVSPQDSTINMKLKKKFLILPLVVCLIAIALTIPDRVKAQDHNTESSNIIWTAENSDPNVFGWMQGSPPPPDKIIRFEDGSYFQFPQMRWSVCHFQQLMPTKSVSRGLSATLPLKTKALPNLEEVTFIPWGQTKPMTWQESLKVNFTDGIIILHHGQIVYEKFFGCLSPTKRHAAMSLTKSFVGLLGEMLVATGELDENRLIKAYIPELRESAFGDATVRQVLDMTTALDYSEDYADPNAEVWQHAAAGNPLPKPENYNGPRTYFQFLQTVQKKGEHGNSFAYKTVNTDVLGWLISRVTDQPITEVLSEKIWSKMGADINAYFTVDSIGTPFAGGGLNAGLRDMARFGQMLLNNGKVGSNQVVPEAVINNIRQGGDRRAFADAGYTLLKGWSYRSMWWITHNDHGAFMARGVHGQSLYIDPTADMVIARFASYPVAGNAANDPTTLPAYQAVANYLMKNDS